MNNRGLNIRIDLSEVVASYDLSKREVEALASSMVESMSSRFVRNIEEQAKTKLHKTRGDYLRGINVRRLQYNVVEISLVGSLPNMIEQGIGAFDMKDGFSKSKNAISKRNGGWYLTIPFTHAAPGSLGESSTFSDVMPSAVHAAVNNVPPGRSLPSSSVPAPHSQVGRRETIVTHSREFQEYQHKYSIYAGMRNMGASGHSDYKTFRRVSDNSDPMSWIHPGFETHGFFAISGNNQNLLHAADIARDVFISKLGL